ncbi:MAG: FKBP-type peptidyl-prolyl cis-trans isomerase [Candidatus Moraniibacteriota bacterium]
MTEKVILIVLVIAAATVTGYVLVQDAKTTIDNPQSIVGKQTSEITATKTASQPAAQTSTGAGATGAEERVNATMDESGRKITPDANSANVDSTPVANTASEVNNSNNKKIMELETKTTQAGTGERVVKSGDKVSMLYTGKFVDGTVFDSSEKHGGDPFDFTIGQRGIIEGWNQGTLGMKLGEKRTLMIPSALAYGQSGQGSIPPNTDLIFEVELVAFQ